MGNALKEVNDLQKQRDELEAQIEQKREAMRAECWDEVSKVLKKYGFNVKDVVPKATVTVSYRDAQGNTWSGRGKRPAWVKELLDSGGSLEALKV